MEFAPQQDIDKEINLLISLERMITDISQMTIDTHPNSDPYIPSSLTYPYLTKAILILKREFLNKYRTNYTMLCNSYLKESSARVNQLIANYVQLARTMSFDKYVRATNLEAKSRDNTEKIKYYNESKEIFDTSEKIFKEVFRDQYHSIISQVEELMKEYEELREFAKVTEFQHEEDAKTFKFSDFGRLKETRTSLRKTIDEHLVRMLGITRVEAKFNSDAS